VAVKYLYVETSGQGFYEIDKQIDDFIKESQISEGICTVFVQHTSASLLIQENADPAVRRDLENWFNRLIPENDELYTHTSEGSDDMPAHIKSSLTASNLSIPIIHNQLALGVWQGIYLWEHRYSAGKRKLVVHLGK